MLGASQRLVRVRWRDGTARDVYSDFNRLTLGWGLGAGGCIAPVCAP